MATDLAQIRSATRDASTGFQCLVNRQQQWRAWTKPESKQSCKLLGQRSLLRCAVSGCRNRTVTVVQSFALNRSSVRTHEALELAPPPGSAYSASSLLFWSMKPILPPDAESLRLAIPLSVVPNWCSKGNGFAEGATS